MGGAAVQVEELDLRIFRLRNGHKTSPTRIRARFAIALGGAALVALTGCGGGGSDTGSSGGNDLKLITEGTLTSASSGEYRPFSYVDEGGKLVGFDKDISDAVAKQMGLKSDTKTGEFSTLIGGIQSHRYDVIIGSMTPTKKRENAVSFTDGYYTSGAQLFVQQSSSCTDPESLKAATIGVASGTTYEDFLKDKKWVASTKTYASDVVALKDLSTGRLDGVVTDKLVGLYQIKQAKSKLKTCGDLLYKEQPAFAVDKGNDALVKKLNEALAKVQDDGTYAKLSKKWFGKDIS